MGGILDDNNAMQVAFLAIAQGTPVAQALNQGAETSALQQHTQQLQQQADYQQQAAAQAAQFQTNAGGTNIDPNDLQGSFARLIHAGATPDQAAAIIKSFAESTKDTRLSNNATMGQQLMQQYMGNNGMGAVSPVDPNAIASSPLPPPAGATANPPVNMQPFSLPTPAPSGAQQKLAKANSFLAMAATSGVPGVIEFAKSQVDQAQKAVEQETKSADEDNKRVIPATQVQDISNNQGLVNKIGDALDSVKKNPDAFGPLGYAEQNFAQNIGADPKNVDARAAVGDLSSAIIKDRSGAAVTLSEFPRLVPFIPQIHDQPSVIKAKLARLKAGIIELNRANISSFKDAGYNTRNLSAEPKAAPSSQYSEGQVAVNPQTGQKLTFSNGGWR